MLVSVSCEHEICALMYANDCVLFCFVHGWITFNKLIGNGSDGDDDDGVSKIVFLNSGVVLKFDFM